MIYQTGIILSCYIASLTKSNLFRPMTFVDNSIIPRIMNPQIPLFLTEFWAPCAHPILPVKAKFGMRKQAHGDFFRA